MAAYVLDSPHAIYLELIALKHMYISKTSIIVEQTTAKISDTVQYSSI